MDNNIIHPLDKLLGANLRRQRCLAKFSQEKLGQLLDPPVSFQQVQKYESGINRLSSNYLLQSAWILKRPVSDFYDKAEDLLMGLNVVIEMPDPDDIDMQINYEKLPIDLKPHVRNLVKGLAHQMSTKDLVKFKVQEVR